MKRYRMMTAVLASAIALIGGVAPGYAEDQKSPAPAVATAGEVAFTAFHRIVDKDFTKKYVAIPKSKDATIIDSRPVRKYGEGRIVTAINIPESAFDEMVKQLPTDKASLLIFYCGGLKCPLSHKSAFAAEKLGYTNVAVYAAGYPDWVASNAPEIDTAFVHSVVENKGPDVIIDSRPKRKFEEGHIPSAVNLPDSDFDELAKTMLPADKATSLIFYCNGQGCPLSLSSSDKAIALGYKNVKLYQAGWPAWKESTSTKK